MSMEAATAVMFGPYRLETRIASGPAATVWRARDTGHGDRTVAVKVFAPHLSHDPQFVAAFRSDAARFDALREPHIVPIHSYGRINGHLYLDMRLVEGPTFADVVRRGPLDEYRSRTLVEQIDAATASMVRGGLAHRSIDPSDVVLTGSPENGEFVQLVGLGIGRPPVGSLGTASSMTPWLADIDPRRRTAPRRWLRW
jgi:serine/threonine-protein kinase